MLSFILKRIVSGVVLLVVVAVGTFFLAHAANPNPAAGLLGSSATPEQQAALSAKLGLDRPLMVQFWDWFSHAIRGDLGGSWNNFHPVIDELVLKVPVTLSIVAASIILAAVAGTVFGLLAGLHPGGMLERIVKVSSVVLFALPGFWIAIVLVVWFAVQLHWFPAVGYVPIGRSVAGWLASITLPAVALAVNAVVAIAEQLRTAILVTNRQDFVRTLRSRGLARWRVGLHILRNSAPAAVTVVALMFVMLLSGAVVVEAIFNLPGIGKLTQSSSQIGDIPVLLGITVVTVAFVVVVNLALDLVLGWLNPKVRVQ